MDIDDLVPDGFIHKGHVYRLDDKCEIKEIYQGVYSPKCDRKIVLNYKDEHWMFCPFCGGRLFDVKG